MQIVPTRFNDLFIIHQFKTNDERGAFVKSFHDQLFRKNNIRFSLKESFYSLSNKNVLRGMHFQTPPYQHKKIVYCAQGALLDVVVDLRKSEPTFGDFFFYELSAENANSLFIGEGFAHGFLALEDNTIMVYNTDCEYEPKHDTGILYNSFGFEWPIKNPLISPRDLSFSSFTEYDSPF